MGVRIEIRYENEGTSAAFVGCGVYYTLSVCVCQEGGVGSVCASHDCPCL